tara:strand:- start:423 stop:1055 length:633 start_codon:yes stop_codon:yes gene_type:complete
MENEYLIKLKETFFDFLEKKQNPKILEFGVRHGISTKLFIDICEKQKGFVISVDVDDYSKKFNSNSWKFIHGRDDDFKLIEKFISKDFDLIYLDSFHDAEHVAKIFYHYYPYLKKNGLFIIDDVSWLMYSKNSERNNFNSEINNHETFYKILNIYSSNKDKFDLKINFRGSGMATIIKKSYSDLSTIVPVVTRTFTIKNLIRRIFRLFKT